jgi:hypothetical protein
VSNTNPRPQEVTVSNPRKAQAPSSLVGLYGPDWQHGVLSEHLHMVPENLVRRLASGTLVVNVDGSAVPVVCSELVRLNTEDGPVDGRCGGRVTASGYACEGHERQLAEWHAMSEMDTMIWERRQDELTAMGGGR